MRYTVIYYYFYFYFFWIESTVFLEIDMAKKEHKIRRYSIVQTFMIFYDIALVLVSSVGASILAHWLVDLEFAFTPTIIGWVIGNVVFSIAVFFALRLYYMIDASIGFPEAVGILLSSIIIAAANILFVWIWGNAHGVGRGTVIFYTTFLLFGLALIRFSNRFYHAVKTYVRNIATKKIRVMIVGCNNDAFTLIRNMVFNDKSRYKPVCIIDNDKHYLGKRIYDVRVVGGVDEAKDIAKKYGVKEIFVALPSTSKSVQRDVLRRLNECGLPLRQLPELSKMTHGEISVSKLRHVEIEDLLGREQIGTNLDEVIGYIENKIVLVTGGGGSIGSELCRQIAMHNPRQLIILDIYENNAYDIEQELRRHYPDLNLLTLIASIRDKQKIRDVFRKHHPQIVFNAAAHKHVPLMETSPNEAVKNNVFGTLNVAKAADEFGVETFVQISTDKAVNPTNIMGATKRICEMIIQTIGKHSKRTKFVAVRFGNVLGSNGSVIPLFKRQIAEGGPVTITHRDIIRYFMTIPEAVSLVLQAGAYAKGGQIFVLDMGEPMKIYDLAYNLIKLSGYEPNVDIEIQCTGLRPGEKLFEERLMAEEGLQKTPNGLISIAQPIPLDEKSFWPMLDNLYEAAYSETDKMKDWVKELVPTYTIDRRESVVYLKVEKKPKKSAVKQEVAATEEVKTSEEPVADTVEAPAPVVEPEKKADKKSKKKAKK